MYNDKQQLTYALEGMERRTGVCVSIIRIIQEKNKTRSIVSSKRDFNSNCMTSKRKRQIDKNESNSFILHLLLKRLQRN